MPALSVVVPTYDTASMTLRCCRAVLASDPDSLELIVVDDGSRDGTAALLARELPRARLIRLETNSGFAVAANHGVAAARGEVVLLLNSDAIVAPEALPLLLAAFVADPRLGVAGAQLFDEDGTPQWSGGRTPTLPWMLGVVSGAGAFVGIPLRFLRGRRKRWHPDTQRELDWVSGAAMAFRSTVWSAAGPLSERYLFYCQDIDFCVEARKAGWRVRLLEDVHITHARGATVAGENDLHYDPAKLWPDLLTWGTVHYGRRWATIARIALTGAAWLRALARRLRHPLRDDATTTAIIRGARRLAQSDS